MGEVLGTFLPLFLLPLLVWVMVYFIIRPPPRSGKWLRAILVGLLALLAAPFLLLGFAFGGVRGVIGVILELFPDTELARTAYQRLCALENK